MVLRGVAFVLTVCACGFVAAQEQVVIKDDVPRDEYLAALQSIAPAARDGAESYMAAYRQRCGRELPTVELRKAVLGSEPVLMKMMQASHARDEATLQTLAASVGCPERNGRRR